MLTKSQKKKLKQKKKVTTKHETSQMLKKLFLKNKSDIVLLDEPWIDIDQVHKSFWNSIGLKPFAFNIRGSRIPSLWCLCMQSLDPVVIFASSPCCAFYVPVNNQNFYMAAVHASTLYQKRKELWIDFPKLEHDYPGAWLFIGDFNAVLGAHEKIGGCLPLKASCDDFSNWTNAGNFTHIRT